MASWSALASFCSSRTSGTHIWASATPQYPGNKGFVVIHHPEYGLILESQEPLFKGVFVLEPESASSIVFSLVQDEEVAPRRRR